MKQVMFKPGHIFIIFSTAICLLTACNERVIPVSLPGTYTGKERVIIRYNKDGQLIFRDDYVKVSLIIDSKGNVTGMAGDATFENCVIKKNRGWFGRQIGIKTDFLIEGSLQGSTFAKDTLINKDISIPFNIEKGELKGSLFMKTSGESFPIISILKLQKMEDI